MAMRSCPSCGAACMDRALYCSACGAQLPHEESGTVMRLGTEEAEPNLRRVPPLIDPTSLGASGDTLTQVAGGMPQSASSRGAIAGVASLPIHPFVGGGDISRRVPQVSASISPSTVVFGEDKVEFDEGSRPRVDVSLRAPELRGTEPEPAPMGTGWAATLGEGVPNEPPHPSRAFGAATAGKGDATAPDAPSGLSEEADPDSVTVVINDGPQIHLIRRNTGTTYDVNLPAMLGKGSRASVMIAGNRHISREHARITVEGEGIAITDNSSSNGTFVNERRLSANTPTRIVSGDVIRLANEEFEFVVEE